MCLNHSRDVNLDPWTIFWKHQRLLSIICNRLFEASKKNLLDMEVIPQRIHLVENLSIGFLAIIINTRHIHTYKYFYIIIDKSQGILFVTMLITSEKYQLMKKIQLKCRLLFTILKRQTFLITNCDKVMIEAYLLFPLRIWFSTNK